MLHTRNLLWIIPLLLLVSFPVWRKPLASFLEPRGGFDPGFGKQDQNVHDFVLEEVVIIQDQLGKKTAEVHADSAYTTDIPNEFELTAVAAELFGTDDEPVEIIADKGLYNTESRKLTLQQNVRVSRTIENQHLFTELLYYYDDKRTIHSPVSTRLVGNNLEITGSSLDYDITTNQYLIGGRVHCVISNRAQE
ncbi:MAG: LPS export ABC transporter periplasmic protein LptC [Desulfocapsaceae bacterium]|jgi:LPS export ABC transporter protein LptC|nr:LPS export ABC transporter periplasmic protein LptC [Desulfocapsaceae bacterium]